MRGDSLSDSLVRSISTSPTNNLSNFKFVNYHVKASPILDLR